MRIARALIAFLLIIILSLCSIAQGCDANDIRPKGGTYGYKQRNGDQRCEGLFVEKVSGLSLDVLSFTQGRLRFYLGSEEKLTIRAPTVAISKMIRVRGISFGMYDSYRLDLELGNNESKKVPVSEVLQPNRIGEKNLGLYGFTGNVRNQIIYIPVSVSSNLYRDKIPDEETRFLKFISNTRIEQAEWRYAVNDNNICGKFSEFVVVPGSLFTPQVPMTIELPEDVGSGAICLDIRFKTVAGEWNSKTFQLFLP